MTPYYFARDTFVKIHGKFSALSITSLLKQHVMENILRMKQHIMENLFRILVTETRYTGKGFKNVLSKKSRKTNMRTDFLSLPYDKQHYQNDRV